jgi:anti-sigma factor (TIGR02949 family)
MMQPEERSKKHVEITQIFSEEEVTFDYFSCEEAITRLNAYLDQELTPSERADVVKHLGICKPCLERFHFEESLMVSLRAKMSAITAPIQLRERLGKLFNKRNA